MRSFYDAHMDVVSPLPVFNLYNYAWPIFTSHGPYPPAKVVHSDVDEVLLSPGVVVSGGSVARSVLSPGVHVAGAEVTGSVLMNDVQVGDGAVIRNAIIDKNVVIPPGARVGCDPDEDRARGFVVQEGLTIAGKDQPYD
jgi:glucose-1-phosphate adenylyltransferase